MTGTEWLVAMAGVALICWINWYFFLAGKTTPVKDVPKDTL